MMSFVAGRGDPAVVLDYHGLVAQVKACAKSRDLTHARQLHLSIRHSVHASDRFLNNLIMDMYSKCGSSKEARSVFDSFPFPNQVSWNIMLACYARHGHVQEAAAVFERMPDRNVVSWNSMISALVRNDEMEQARLLFDRMENKNVVSWTTMLTGYAGKGQIREARRIFDEIPCKNAVSWTAIVTAYAELGEMEEARRLFQQMPERSVSSWNAMLVGYANNGQMQEAQSLFEKMPQRNDISWTVMITAYSNAGRIRDAARVFNRIPRKGIPSWNAMITAYARNGDLQEAKALFNKMAMRDAVTWTAMLTGYAQNGHLEEARAIFDAMPQRVIVSWNAMLTAYTQQGKLMEAKELFDTMKERNVSSWNALLSGHVKNGDPKGAIRLFFLMDQEGLHPNAVTYVSVMDACSSAPALAEGQLIHTELLEANCSLIDTPLANAILNMYARCGKLDTARQLFESMASKGLWSWNAMIGAYSYHGQPAMALELFWEMWLEGKQPDEVTLMTVVSACSHAGDVDAGCAYFALCVELGQTGQDIYACMVDLLGRGGWLDEAEELLQNIPKGTNKLVAWATLLGGCRLHEQFHRGLYAAKHVLNLSPASSSAYLFLSSLYQQ